MKWRKGPRPWSVRLFATALLAAALVNLIEALRAHEALLMARWFARLPLFGWTPDFAIIASFSQFSIALIPLVWIYFLASNRARWVVLVFGIVKIGLSVPPASSSVQLKAPGLIWLEAGLVVVALIMLFWPSTSRWVMEKGEGEHAVFE